MADKVLVCKDCKAEFVFTESEQAFYKEKGFDNEPQRCPACRRAKKQERNHGNGDRNFGGGNNRGGQKNFGKKR
ncbi:MAG: cytochrome [Herbinix sp.]|nr:cytochrome [Herbinix sp.]